MVIKNSLAFEYWFVLALKNTVKIYLNFLLEHILL